MKDVFFMGNTRASLRGFPLEIKQEVGFALSLAQRNEKPINAVPLVNFGGAGVLEIVSSFDTDAYRTVYTVSLGDVIYVLHVFQKKSKTGRKTPQRDLNLIRLRLKGAKDHYARIKADKSKEKANAGSER